MIVLNNINKRFKNLTALNNFSLKIEKGEIHGLIGPNGSGKTTAVGVILSLLNFEGSAEISFSENNVGVSLENTIFFERLTVYENLRFIAILKNVNSFEIKNIIEKLQLQNEQTKKIKSLSKGNRRKVSIAQTLIGNPDFYIFDEPLSGLDHDNIILFRDLISELKQQKKTVLINSHILSEIEKICTDITFIYKGETKGTYNTNEIVKTFGTLENAYSEIISKN